MVHHGQSRKNHGDSRLYNHGEPSKIWWLLSLIIDHHFSSPKQHAFCGGIPSHLPAILREPTGRQMSPVQKPRMRFASKWYGQLRQSNSGTYKHPTCFRSCFHILIYVVHCWDNNPTGVLYHASSLATHTTSYQMDEMCWSPITFMFRCLVHFIIKTAKPLQNHVMYKL